jgi:hypothetical protein
MSAPTIGRAAVACILALGLVSLSACGDKPQEGTTAAKKADAKAWDGTKAEAYRAEGWTAGDRASWEQQLKKRGQNQNEYTRVQ